MAESPIEQRADCYADALADIASALRQGGTPKSQVATVNGILRQLRSNIDYPIPSFLSDREQAS